MRGWLAAILKGILLVAGASLALVSSIVHADIPALAQQASNNATQVGLLVKLAKAAEARGDLLACAALAKEADRLATVTDLLKQEAVVEYNQLPDAQKRQVFTKKEEIIADATITRADADSVKGCLNKVYAIAIAFAVFLVILFWWLFWRAFGPFRTDGG